MILKPFLQAFDKLSSNHKDHFLNFLKTKDEGIRSKYLNTFNKYNSSYLFFAKNSLEKLSTDDINFVLNLARFANREDFKNYMILEANPFLVIDEQVQNRVNESFMQLKQEVKSSDSPELKAVVNELYDSSGLKDGKVDVEALKQLKLSLADKMPNIVTKVGESLWERVVNFINDLLTYLRLNKPLISSLLFMKQEQKQAQEKECKSYCQTKL